MVLDVPRASRGEPTDNDVGGAGETWGFAMCVSDDEAVEEEDDTDEEDETGDGDDEEEEEEDEDEDDEDEVEWVGDRGEIAGERPFETRTFETVANRGREEAMVELS